MRPQTGSDNNARREQTTRAIGAVILSYVLFVLLGLLFLTRPASAQEVEISGYYEHTFQVDYTEKMKDLLMDASKLRIDFASGLGEGLQFNGNINLIVYHKAIWRDITPFLPPSVADSLEQRDKQAIYPLPGERTYLDNAYLTWEMGNLRLRAGKQQLAWGPAYAFNPTDLFHHKNMLDPTYEKEGVTALRADYRWGFGNHLTLIAAPGEDVGETGYALRMGTHVEKIGYDVALTLHSVTDSTAVDPTNWWQWWDEGPRKQRRRALGLEFSGALFGLGLWCEGNYNWMEIEEDFTRIAFGTDYTLNSGLYLMAEALYNGRAEAHTPYPIHDWLATIAYGEPVGQWWYLAGLSKDVSDLTRGSLYLFGTPDGSLVINPRLDISIAQNADLVVFGGLTFGEEEGAFPPGLFSLVTRATVWF